MHLVVLYWHKRETHTGPKMSSNQKFLFKSDKVLILLANLGRETKNFNPLNQLCVRQLTLRMGVHLIVFQHLPKRKFSDIYPNMHMQRDKMWTHMFMLLCCTFIHAGSRSCTHSYAESNTHSLPKNLHSLSSIKPLPSSGANTAGSLRSN